MKNLFGGEVLDNYTEKECKLMKIYDEIEEKHNDRSKKKIMILIIDWMN